MKLRLLTFTAAIAALLSAATTAPAQDKNPWSVRLRATYMETADESDAFSALGINFAPDSIEVQSKLIPEIDVVYALTPHLSAELVLTIPQKHDVSLRGVGHLGTFKHLPPTLLVQYHFFPDAKVRPYVGGGLNYTLIYDSDLKVAGVPLALDNCSFGLAAQAGVDVTITPRLSFNLDVKKAAIRTDVSAGGAKLTEARVDPWLFSVGLKWAL